MGLNYRARIISIVLLVVLGILVVCAHGALLLSTTTMDNVLVSMAAFFLFWLWLFMFLLQSVLVRMFVFKRPLRFSLLGLLGALGTFGAVYAASCAQLGVGSPIVPLIMMTSFLPPFGVARGIRYVIIYLSLTLPLLLCMHLLVLRYGAYESSSALTERVQAAADRPRRNKLLLSVLATGLLGLFVNIFFFSDISYITGMYSWCVFFSTLLLFPFTIRFLFYLKSCFEADIHAFSDPASWWRDLSQGLYAGTGFHIATLCKKNDPRSCSLLGVILMAGSDPYKST